MKYILLTALCGASILVSGCTKSPTPDSVARQKPDSVLLQGTWTGQEIGVKAQGSPSLVLAGDKCEFRGANPQEWYKATFKLREDTTPKQLEAVITDCPAQQYVGKTAHGIYKIEDGRFTLTANAPGNPATPASFDAQGARQFVLTKK